MAQAEELLALQPRLTAVPFPALDPTQNWQFFVSPDKQIETVLSIEPESPDILLFS